MDIRETLNRTTLSAALFVKEFGDEPQVWTVEKAYNHAFADKEETLMKFREHPWAITLNDTRSQSLMYGFGTNITEEMHGQQVRITHAQTTNDKGPCPTIVFQPLPGKPKKRRNQGDK